MLVSGFGSKTIQCCNYAYSVIRSLDLVNKNCNLTKQQVIENRCYLFFLVVLFLCFFLFFFGRLVCLFDGWLVVWLNVCLSIGSFGCIVQFISYLLMMSYYVNITTINWMQHALKNVKTPFIMDIVCYIINSRYMVFCTHIFMFGISDNWNTRYEWNTTYTTY